MKIGDRVKLIRNDGKYGITVTGFTGKLIEIHGQQAGVSWDQLKGSIYPVSVQDLEVYSESKLGGYMNEVLKDFSGFLKQHRSVLYTVALVVIVDHFLLGGKFRAKLQDIMEGLLNKAKDSLDAKQ